MTTNKFVVIESAGKPIKAWIRGVQVEDAAEQQLRNLASLPFIHSHIAVMPDVHYGMGATVGSVIATKGAIIPAAVGVDIGCGMSAQRTSLMASDLPDNLLGLRTEIEKRIPHGRTNNGMPGDRGAWDVCSPGTTVGLHVGEVDKLLHQLQQIVAKHPKLDKPARRALTHAGTLGTGNHFVEVCLDETDRVWIMLHSGSRGIGNAIGSYFIEKAKEDMKRWFINLPDKDLAYFPQGSELFRDYCEAVEWAQNFARLNRDLMMSAAVAALRQAVPKPFTLDETAVNCHHNYVSWENHFNENVMVTRKGAVRAREGELGIIPGSMGARSFIVRGKGNKDSFCSCSHGAGRAMSRTEARRRFTLEDHIAATVGVECRKDEEVIDETPAAYKDIEAVMAAQSDLVEIVRTLRQVVCVKG
jgi:tRNA-splicing ligase RtcB